MPSSASEPSVVAHWPVMWAVTAAASPFSDEALQLSVLHWTLYMDLTYLKGSRNLWWAD